MNALAAVFENETGFSVKISSASTGKLYAQITRGAPFDVFLSADHARPARLVAEGLADQGSLRTYARGQLVMVAHVSMTPEENSPEPSPSCERLLRSKRVRHLAIANPRTAPYGLAAQQTLERVEAWEGVRSKLVRGENISQTFQFVESGSAQAGFIAESQLRSYSGRNLASCRWHVPAENHQPIEQKMVVLGKSVGKPAVSAFQAFLGSDRATSIILDSGYAL